MTRSRDNVPRWLDRLLVVGLAAVLAVCALALYVVAASSPANATDGCVGNPDYCSPPEETAPTWPNTTEPNPSTSSSPPSSGPSTTSPSSQPTSTAPSPTSSSSAPTTSTAPSSTVSVVPPPVPPTTCAPDADGRAFGPDCTIDPCVIHDLGYWSDDYQGDHLPGGDHGYTRYHAWNCTVPTVPPTSVSPNLPVTGGNGTTLSFVALGLLSAGTALVAASRRRPA